MTRSTLASRTGAAVPLGVSGTPEDVALLVPLAPVLDGVVGLDPPQALRARAATPVTAAAPSARLCMDSPLKPGGTRRHRCPECSKKLQTAATCLQQVFATFWTRPSAPGSPTRSFR